MGKCPNCQHEFSLRKPIPEGIFCCECVDETQATKKWKLSFVLPDQPEITHWYYCDEHYKTFRADYRKGYKQGLITGQKILDELKYKEGDKI